MASWGGNEPARFVTVVKYSEGALRINQWSVERAPVK
jgi:hypothetical protein